MTSEVINPIQYKKWDDFVNSQKYSSIYHTSAWCKVLSDTYGFQPSYLVETDQRKKIVAALPLMVVRKIFGGKKLVSLPFTPHCNPLSEYKEQVDYLINSLFKLQNSMKSSSFGIRMKSNGIKLKRDCLTENDQFIGHTLSLGKNIDEIRLSFHKSSIQRPIRKSENSALTIRFSQCLRDVKEFYHLHLLTRRKHGVPTQPFRYFANMWNILHPKGYIEILLATYRGKTIAGILLLKYNNTVIYQNGASDIRFLRFHPNHLLLWKAIKYAKVNGYQVFDFGRSELGEEGLIRFKREMGGRKISIVLLFISKARGFN